MSDENQKRSRLPSPAVRIGVYIVIIVIILLLRAHKPQPVEDDGANPTVEDLAPKPEREPPIDLTVQFYPQITLYAWSSEKIKDGVQRILVLLRFERNVSELAWNELKLYDLKNEKNPLASATPPENQPKPGLGISLLRFDLSVDTPALGEGRIWCWNKFLVTLPAGQKLSPDLVRENFKEALAEDKSKASPPQSGEPIGPSRTD